MKHCCSKAGLWWPTPIKALGIHLGKVTEEQAAQKEGKKERGIEREKRERTGKLRRPVEHPWAFF